jgi:hypothetical protein
LSLVSADLRASHSGVACAARGFAAASLFVERISGGASVCVGMGVNDTPAADDAWWSAAG